MITIHSRVKPAFTVIGMEGSTDEGGGMIARLWTQANARFGEVAALAKVDERGNPVGFWGAMSDFSRAFKPWEHGFTKGLYLAGVEARDDAEPPDGWVKWRVPGFEYLYADAGGDAANGFALVLREVEARGLSLAGAAHDFIDPANGRASVYLPIRRLEGE